MSDRLPGRIDVGGGVSWRSLDIASMNLTSAAASMLMNLVDRWSPAPFDLFVEVGQIQSRRVLEVERSHYRAFYRNVWRRNHNQTGYT